MVFNVRFKYFLHQSTTGLFVNMTKYPDDVLMQSLYYLFPKFRQNPPTLELSYILTDTDRCVKKYLHQKVAG